MENSTETDVSLPFMQSCPSPVVCIIEVTVVITVTFLILTGNIAYLTILVSTPKLRNGHGYLLMSLSVADLMTGIMAALAVYPSATLQASPDSWPYGDTICLIVAYVSQVGITSSGASLLLLSIERYIAVAHPLRYSRVVTKKATLICIAVVWLVSAGVFSTVFAGFPKHHYFSSLYVCLPQLIGSPFVTPVVAFVVAPVLVIIVTSCLVSRKLKSGPSQASARTRASRSRTKIKMQTFRMVQVVTATFVLCYIPSYLTFFVSIVARVSLPQVLTFGLYWLLLANSFFNTLIYFTMNAAYRKRLDELLTSVASAVSLTFNGSRKTESISKGIHTADLKRPTDSAFITIQRHDSAV